MPRFIDFAALKAAVPIEEAARALKLKLKPEGNAFRCECPVAETSDPRHILITPGKGFICFACSENGGILNLAMHIKGFKTPGEAGQFFMEQFGTGEPTVQDSTVCKPRANSPPERQRAEPTAPIHPAALETWIEPSQKWQREQAKGKHPPQTHSFDPDSFLQKLTTPEGMSEADAKTFRVGMHRNALYIPAVYPSGSLAGWWKLEDGKLVAPKQWLPDTSNVVRLRTA